MTPERIEQLADTLFGSVHTFLEKKLEAIRKRVEDVERLLVVSKDELADVRKDARTFSDGTLTALRGEVATLRAALAERPERGEPGANGKDADFAAVNGIVQLAVRAAIAEIPPPRDGEPGKSADPVDMDEVERMVRRRAEDVLAGWERPRNGADGLGFDDVGIALKEDGRTMVLRFSKAGREDRTFEIVAPWQIYRGPYQDGRRYDRGDNVTKNGCQWTCAADTTTTPPSPDWVQSTKAGRDGRDK